MTPVRFPILRWVAIAWLAIWIPTYAQAWGPRNFILLCDVSVLVACAGLIAGNRLLVASQAVASPVVGALWLLDALSRLTTGRHALGGTEYLWDDSRSVLVRVLSLFHVGLPVLMLALVKRHGYDRRALALQGGLCAGTLLLSRVMGDATRNHNYVFFDPLWKRSFGPPSLHLLAVWATLVVAFYTPIHMILKRGRPSQC